MAVRVDASTEGLRRTSDFPSTTYTMAGWLYISAVGQTDWNTVCNYMEDSNVYHILYCRDNTTWRFQIYNSLNNATILTPSINTWYFCGMRNSGTTLTGFAAAIGATSLTTASPSGGTAPSPVAELSLGRNQAWTEWTNGRFFNWMVWDGVALTNEQLLMQMYSTQPVVGLEYLHLWTPLLGAGDLVDYSGNGRNWTSAGGTLTTEDGPPVSWGAPVLVPERLNPWLPPDGVAPLVTTGIKLEDSNENCLVRTSDLPSMNSNYTIMLWAYPDTSTGGWTTPINLSTETGYYDLIQADWSSGQWELYIQDSGGFYGGYFGASSISLNTWQHLAMVRYADNDHQGFLNGISKVTETVAIDPRTVGGLAIGSTGAGSPSEWFDGRVAYIKIWTAALTAAEIQAEMYSAFPKRTADLYGYWPLYESGASSVKDYSGNGRDFTVSYSGTLPTTLPGPNVGWGAPVLELPQIIGATGTNVSDSQPAYARGSASTASSKPAYVAGSLAASDSQQAYAAGSQAASSSKAAYAEGVTAGGTASDRVAAYVEGVGLALVPDGDVSYSGAWKNELGTQVNLYESINEYPDPSDSDYVWYDDAHLNEYFEVTLSDPGGVPGAGDVKIHWRIADFQSTGNVQLTVQLREGAAVIASTSQTAPSSGTTYTYTLSSGEKASITDWSNLRLRFIITQIT